jgi:hypothetical protein
MWALPILFAIAFADLPVHCLYKQILGDWTFRVDDSTFSAGLHDSETFCGHSQPDAVLSLPGPDFMYTFENYEDHLVTLSEPNRASSPTLGHGTWTMVYDEGLIVNFPTQSFFNYLMYVVDEYPGNYMSVCDKTMKGWVRGPDPHDHANWGCWFGFKQYVEAEGSKEAKKTCTNDFRWVQPVEFV